MTKDEIDFTKFIFFFSTGRNWIVRLMNLNDKSVKIAGKTYSIGFPSDFNTFIVQIH